MIFCTITVLFLSCKNNEIEKVRSMEINAVDLSRVADGNYRGDFTYGDFTYVVEVVVRSNRIEAIEILENRDSKYSKMAEAVAEKVMDRQQNNVDVITGATTTSKAFLKAIENALKKGYR
ncbi:MAG: FMN-binding protein [FCB group bacterium]|nr:FMN-binding protein [FCB group bacterium]